MKTFLSIIAAAAVIGLCADPARPLGAWWFPYEGACLAVLIASAKALERHERKHPETNSKTAKK